MTPSGSTALLAVTVITTGSESVLSALTDKLAKVGSAFSTLTRIVLVLVVFALADRTVRVTGKHPSSSNLYENCF
jgi:phage-related holin